MTRYIENSSGAPVARLILLLAGANLAAWVWAWTAFSAHPALLGTALLAWVFGLRHAVDADHIAAIDNATRKLMGPELMGANDHPVRVGLFFSLGHATVVVLAALAAAGVAGALQSWLAEVKDIAAPIGNAVSAVFLLLIALANLALLRGTWRGFRQVQPVDSVLGGGLLARLLRPALRAVTRSWHMYPLGFLFGLGFDTATEIGLLGIAATEATHGLSPWQTLVFPALFTAGMALVDTADSALMVRAYGWALVHPLRKFYYNLTVTAVSVLVALLIGGIEALGMIGRFFGLEGTLWRGVASLQDHLADMGLAVIAIFFLCWAVSAFVYRRKGYDAGVLGT
jgi:high-affinity nickel-transport protein